MTMQEKISPGYKQSEIGVIPEDWAVKPLSELTDPERPIGYGIVQTGPSVLNGIPCVRVLDLVDGRISRSNLITTSKEISLSYKRTLLREGDLVIALRGKVGALAKVDAALQGANLTRGVALLSKYTRYVPEYLLQYLSSSIGQALIEKNFNGSALQEIPIASLRKLPIAVPADAEQRAIAEALSDADARIAALEALIAKKRDLKQAAMQQLLTGKTRLPGFSGDWEAKRLGEFAQFLSGTYLAKPAYRPGTVVVQGAGAAMGEHDTANFPFAITVIGRVGTVGRPRFMPGGCWVNNNAAAIRALPSESDPRFVHLLLTQYDWSLATSVTAQPFLGIGTLMCSTHRLPPKAEQTAIAEVIFDMDAELSSLEAEADKARAIKQGMMQNLLTGKVRLV